MPFQTSRRTVLLGSLALPVAFRPSFGLAAEEGAVRVRSRDDLTVLDPANMKGGLETEFQFACLPALVKYLPGEILSWVMTDYVESFSETSPTRIEFALRPGFE